MPPTPTFVIRPPEIWDTRAPLHAFFLCVHEVQRDYSLLTLAVTRTRYDASHRRSAESTSAANFIRADASGPVAGKAWKGYREWWRKAYGNPTGQPSIDDLEHDLGVALYAIRELSIVEVASVFESFVQCWALNMLLTRLESGGHFSPGEEDLARNFSAPFARTVPRILETFSSMATALEQRAHIKTDPETGKELEEPIQPQLNSLRAILFWRAFRNSIVHQGGFISSAFCTEHRDFFEAMRQPYGTALRPLQAGGRLQLPSVLFYAMVSVHVRAAVFMNKRLQEVSGRRRGTIYLPESGMEEPSRFDPSLRPLPLLIEGDHVDSLRRASREAGLAP